MIMARWPVRMCALVALLAYPPGIPLTFPASTEIQPSPEWKAAYEDVWRFCVSNVEQTPEYRWEELRWFRVLDGEFLYVWSESFQIAANYRNFIFLSPQVAADSKHYLWVIRHELAHAQLRQHGHRVLDACNL